MSSVCDSRQALAAMTSIITAFTSATGVSTATFNTSLGTMGSVDTSLTAQELKIVTLVTTAIFTATPAAAIHNGTSFPIDSRTLFGAMTSIIVALSSAVGTSTGNFATALAAQQTADTALTSVETGLVTLLTSALASATPSATAHLQV